MYLQKSIKKNNAAILYRYMSLGWCILREAEITIFVTLVKKHFR